MSRKKGSKKNRADRAAAEEDWDDSSSTTSSFSCQGGNSIDDVNDEESVADEQLDFLLEKRSSLREAGLRGLIQFLSRNVSSFVEERFDTLLASTLQCLRKGAANEQILAAKLLGLMSISMGGGEAADEILQRSSQTLSKLAKGSNPTTKMTAIETLAMAEFIANYNSDAGSVSVNVGSAMEMLFSTLHGKSENSTQKKSQASQLVEDVQTSALISWTLLLTVVPPIQRAQFVSTRDLGVLSRMLEHSCAKIRTATGEALAVLHEAGEEEDSMTDDDEDSLSEEIKSPKGDEGPNEDLDLELSDVVGKMRTLASESNRRRVSKSDKRSERKKINVILSSLEAGECREVAIKLRHGDSVYLTTWTHVLQMNALRKILGEGFQTHLQENEFLHYIFDYNPQMERSEKFQSRVEKRLFQSPNSAASRRRTQERRKSRKSSLQENNYFEDD